MSVATPIARPVQAEDREYEFKQMVRAKLEESEAVANDPTAKRYTHEEVFAPLRKKYGYQV